MKKSFLNGAIFLAPLLFLYIFCLSPYVQYGDSGELVANAYHLRTIHPPGYPLYGIVYHFLMKAIPFGSIFYKASLVTALFGYLSLILLYVSTRKRLIDLMLIYLLGTSETFWRYCVLPDVFSLNCLFISIFLLVYVRPEFFQEKKTKFVLASSVLHHHTIIFFLPLIVESWLRTTKKFYHFFEASVFVSLCLSLYCLLLLFDSSALGSWRQVDSIPEIINHFLRKDYGTFSLTIGKNSFDLFQNLNLLALNLTSSFWSIFIIVFSYIFRIKKFREQLKVNLINPTVTILSYIIIFFSLSSGYSSDGHYEIMFERFFLPASMFLIFIISSIVNDKKLTKFIIGLNILVSLGIFIKMNNYSKSTIIEDYSINVLESLPEKAALYTHGDTITFSIYYVQSVLGKRLDVPLFSTASLYPENIEKINKIKPSLFIKNDGSTILNLNDNVVFSTEPSTFFFITPLEQRSLVTKIGVKNRDYLNKCDDFKKYRLRSTPIGKNYNYFSSERWIFGLYSRCKFGELLKEINSKNYSKAIELAGEISSFDPDFLPAIERKCHVLNIVRKNDRDCNKKFEEVRERIDLTNFNYTWIIPKK